jgi:hypothetical protein
LSLRVLPSSRGRVVANQEIEAKAVCGLRSPINVDKVVVVISRASEEPTAIVGQVVKLALLGDSKSSLRGSLTDSGIVRLGISQGTNVIDIDLLTARDFDFEVEGVFATGEDGIGCVGAFDVGRAGGGGLVEEPEVAVVGIDGCELNGRAGVDGKALEGALGCGSCGGRADESESKGGGRSRLHFDGKRSWLFGMICEGLV